MLSKRLKKARQDKGLTQSALAKELGVTRNAVSLWESGDSKPTSERLRTAAVVLDVDYDWLATGRGGPSGRVVGLPLKGDIAGGVWSEIPESQDMDVKRVPVAPDARFPAECQYALRVTGTSVDRIAPDGAMIACVDIITAGIEVREGDPVVVERRRGSLVETTVKVVRRGKKGGLELWPESNDPAHQTRIQAGAKDASDITIKALVIGVYTPLPRGG